MKKLLSILIIALFCSQGVVNAQKPELRIQSPPNSTFIKLSHDGTCLISYNPSSKVIRLWDVHTGRLIRDLIGHTRVVLSLDISIDDKYIVSAGAKTIKLWNIKTGTEIYSLNEKHKNVQFTQSGNIFISGSGKSKILDVSDGKVIRSFENIKGKAEISPDGKYIIALATLFDKKYKPYYALQIYDFSNGKLIKTFDKEFPKTIVDKLMFSPDGKYVVSNYLKFSNPSVSPDAKSYLDLWDVAKGKFIKSLGEFDFRINSIDYSPDGKYIAVGGGSISDDISKAYKLFLLDIETAGRNDISYNGKTMVQAVCYTNDGNNIIFNGLNNIIFWNINEDKVLKTIKSVATIAYIATFAENDLFIGSSFYRIDSTSVKKEFETIVKYFNIKTGVEARSIDIKDNHLVFSFSDDGMIVVTANPFEKPNQLRVNDLFSNRIIQSFNLPKENDIVAANISPSKKYLISSEFALKEKKSILRIWGIDKGQEIRSLTQLGYLSKTAISYDDKYILAGGSATDAPYLILMDFSGKKIFSPKNNGIFIQCLDFSHDSKYFIAGTLNINYVEKKGQDKHTIKLRDINGNLIKTFKGHNDKISFVKFSPDDKYLVSCSADNTMKLWDVSTGSEIHSFNYNSGFAPNVKFSKNGKFIVSAGSIEQLTIWDVNAKKELLSFILLENGKDWVVTTPDGRFDGTKEGMKQALHYVMGMEVIPLESLYEKFYTPNLWARVMGGEIIEKPDIDITELLPLAQVRITDPVKDMLKFRGFILVNLSTSQKKIAVKAEITDNGGGIDEIRVYQNGKFLISDKPGINTKGEMLSKTFNIELSKGINTIKISAYNLDRTEKSDNVVIDYTGDVYDAANLYVLAIGINNYKKSTYNLNYAVPDATAFVAALQTGSTGIFGKVEVQTFYNETATKQKITQAFTAIKEKANQSDVFIFYYAGHGSMGSDNAEFYLIPWEITNLYNTEFLKQNAISAENLKNFSKEIKAQKQLFIIDACQSGGAVEYLASRGSEEERAIAQLAHSTGTYWLTASGSDQVAGEFKTLGHGVFTYAVLEGLKGNASLNDKKVTVKELSFYVGEKVPELSEKYKGSAQYPVSHGYGQDFPVVIVK